MKCLRKYAWVKLERNRLPEGKGILGSWMKLASRAAFRKGKASYCGHINDISVGMWAGGVVGVKSILGARNRSEALQTLDKLSALGYVEYELNTKTKKLTYRMKDWVIECSGAECMDGTVYATEGYGFLCVPRNLTNRLVEQNYIFEEADAFLDLWCHTIFADPDNAFSFLYPIIQYGKQEAALTLETLGQRWKWEKTKVWRFFKKYNDVFEVKRLPGSYGCLVFNKIYPIGEELDMPNQEKILRILNEIRILGRYTQKKGTDHEHINKLIAWFSRKVIEKYAMAEDESVHENRVALFGTYNIRAYLSPMKCKNCIYDCEVVDIEPDILQASEIRGPCILVDISNIGKELFVYEE